jgi:hypothetical protein
VTDLTDRIKALFAQYRPAIAYSDLTEDEKRLVIVGAACAAALLWFAVALVEVWLLLALPLLAGGCVWLVRKKRARPGREEELEDWSY